MDIRNTTSDMKNPAGAALLLAAMMSDGAHPIEAMEAERPGGKRMTATLIVSRSSSRCGHCGRQTMPDWQTHDAVSGYYSKNKPGCGLEFTAITSDSPLDAYWFSALSSMRPDLPIVDYVTGKPLDLSIDYPECPDCGEGCAGHGPALICNPCGQELRQCRCAEQEQEASA